MSDSSWVKTPKSSRSAWLLDLATPGVCDSPGLGQHRQSGSAVVRIARPAYEAVGLEAIDQLRDVRLDAGKAFGQLAERERLAGFGQPIERGELRERKADVRQPGLDAVLQHARRVQHRE